MKYRTRPRLFMVLALCVSSLVAFGQRGETVSKSYDWQYTVAATDHVEFLDRYGSINIETTNGNQLEVVVNVEAWATTPAAAQALLNAITVRHTQATGSYSFATAIDEKGLLDAKRKGFQVRYTIKMPKTLRLRVQQSYGNVTLGDYTGETDLRVKYGSLRAGNLSGRFNTLDLRYSGGRIESVAGGTLVLAYSSGYFELGTVGELRFNPRYAKARIESAERLELDAAYSEINLGTVGTLTGTATYSELEMESVKTRLTLTARYLGDLRLHQLSPTFERVELDVAYSDITLGLPRGINTDFDLNVDYGDLSGFSTFQEVAFRHRENHEGRSLHYRGTLGNGGNRLITLTGRYSDISLQAF